MDTTIIREILNKVQPKFLEDFEVTVTVLAYFVEHDILAAHESTELLTEPKSRVRLYNFFAILSKKPKSLDVLIDYFRSSNSRGQEHLLELLQTTRTNVMAQQPATGDNQSNRIVITREKITKFVNIIIQNGVALQEWESILYRILDVEYNRSKIQDMLNANKSKELIVRKTLELYISEQKTPPTVDDFLNRLTDQYLQLQGEIRRGIN